MSRKWVVMLGVLMVLLATANVVLAQGPLPPTETCPDTRGSNGTKGGWGWGARGFSLVDVTAEATGLAAEEVIAALQEGQTLAQIAAAQGVDAQAIVDAFLAARETVFEQAVADGRFTQEQVDLMLEQMAEHVSAQLTEPWTAQGRSGQSGMGGMRGGGRGRMGGMGGRGGSCPLPNSELTPGLSQNS